MPETLFFCIFTVHFQSAEGVFRLISSKFFFLSVSEYTYNRHNTAYNHTFIKVTAHKIRPAKHSP